MSEIVRMMDGGDGRRYADTSNIGRIQAKTSGTFTIPEGAPDGYVYSNRGSGATTTYILPRPLMGRRIRFLRLSSLQTMTVQRSGTANIVGAVTPFTGTQVSASTASERGTVELLGDGTDWIIISPSGAWTIS